MYIAGVCHYLQKWHGGVVISVIIIALLHKSPPSLLLVPPKDATNQEVSECSINGNNVCC